MTKKKTKKLPTLSLSDAREITSDALAEELPAIEADYGPGSRYGSIRFFEGKLVIKGDLDLDEQGSIVVLGDLEVKGSIRNLDGDFGPLLMVSGELKAKNLVAGGSEIHVGGGAIIGNAVYGHYNHGTLLIAGDLKAKGVLCNDHSISVAGKIVAPVLCRRGTMARR